MDTSNKQRALIRAAKWQSNFHVAEARMTAVIAICIGLQLLFFAAGFIIGVLFERYAENDE